MEGKELKWALKERMGREDAGLSRLESSISKDRNVRVRHSDLKKIWGGGMFHRTHGCVVVAEAESNMETQLCSDRGAKLGFHDM